jgi:hypothetical protein
MVHSGTDAAGTSCVQQLVQSVVFEDTTDGGSRVVTPRVVDDVAVEDEDDGNGASGSYASSGYQATYSAKEVPGGGARVTGWSAGRRTAEGVSGADTDAGIGTGGVGSGTVAGCIPVVAAAGAWSTVVENLSGYLATNSVKVSHGRPCARVATVGPSNPTLGTHHPL